MYNTYLRESVVCKNCGKWTFKEEIKERPLEEKIKVISELLNRQDDEVPLNKIREIINERPRVT